MIQTPSGRLISSYLETKHYTIHSRNRSPTRFVFQTVSNNHMKDPLRGICQKLNKLIRVSVWDEIGQWQC